LLVYREIDPGEDHRARQLFCEVFKQPMSESLWRWKYRGFLSKAKTKSFAVGGFTPEGDLVAHAGALVFPGVGADSTRAHPAQVRSEVVQICDVMIADPWRGPRVDGSVYQRLMFHLRGCLGRMTTKPFAYGFPGLRPFRLGERLGFYRGIQALRLHVWTTPFEASQRIRVDPLPWATALPWVDDDWNGRSHDVLTPLIARNAAYVEWRYASHPLWGYQFWLVSRRIGPFSKQLGWMVTRGWHDGILAVDGLFRRQTLPGHHQLQDRENVQAVLQRESAEFGEAVSAMAALRARLSGEQKLWCWGAEAFATIKPNTTPMIAMQFIIDQPEHPRPRALRDLPNSSSHGCQFTPGDTDVF